MDYSKITGVVLPEIGFRHIEADSFRDAPYTIGGVTAAGVAFRFQGGDQVVAPVTSVLAVHLGSNEPVLDSVG